ncbi:MAG: hypothetical protein QXS38_02440 [Candidatus Pacearchaeota archaeon]
MSIFEGIGKAISELFTTNPEKESAESLDDLENKINNIIAKERQNIRPSREDIDTFS